MICASPDCQTTAGCKCNARWPTNRIQAPTVTTGGTAIPTMTADIKALEAVAEARRCLERDQWCAATTLEHKTVRLLLNALTAQSAELTRVEGERDAAQRLATEHVQARFHAERREHNAHLAVKEERGLVEAAEARALTAEALLDKAVEALEPFADDSNWSTAHHGMAGGEPIILEVFDEAIADDARQRARSTVSEIKETRR